MLNREVSVFNESSTTVKVDMNITADVTEHLKVKVNGGSVAKRLERWTCNPETASSSPTLTASWICSW